MNVTTIQPFGLFPTPLLFSGAEEEATGSLLEDAAHIWAAEDSAGTPATWLDSGTNPGGVDMAPTADPVPTGAGRWDKFGAEFSLAAADRLQVADEAALRLSSSQSVTWAVWFKPSPDGLIFAKSSPTILEYSLHCFTGGLAFMAVIEGQHYSIAGVAGYVEDEWNLAVCWWDAGSGECGVRLNGAANVTDSSPAAYSDTVGAPFTIGDLSYLPGVSGFDGAISELVRWNRMLTEAEMDSLLTASVFDLGSGVTTDEGTITTDEGTLTTDES